MSAEAIRWPERVRQRPHLYIGNVRKEGLYRLLREVVENAVSEAAIGYATYVRVTLWDDGSVQVSDDGRGIPVTSHWTGIPVLQAVLSKHHSWATSRGLDYLVESDTFRGVSVVTALSVKLQAVVKTGGFLWFQEYDYGIPNQICRGKATIRSGTTIRFWPDPLVFGPQRFDFESISQFLSSISQEAKGVLIQLWDPGRNEYRNFYYLGPFRVA